MNILSIKKPIHLEADMAVSYKKLWHILLDRDMDRKDLEQLAHVSHYTMTKMGKNQDVSTEALRNICAALNCKLDDIIEFLPDDFKANGKEARSAE